MEIDRWDVCVGTGFALAIAGLGWAWPPLVPIVLGAVLLAAGVYGATKWRD